MSYLAPDKYGGIRGDTIYPDSKEPIINQNINIIFDQKKFRTRYLTDK